MNEWRLAGIVVLESILSLTLGLGITSYFVHPIYEQFGIAIRGDVWVVWFAVAIILFSGYTMIMSRFVTYPLHRRLKSTLFWIMFLISIGIVAVPFVIGRIPY